MSKTITVLCLKDYFMYTGERVFTAGLLYVGTEVGPGEYSFIDDEEDEHFMPVQHLFYEGAGHFKRVKE